MGASVAATAISASPLFAIGSPSTGRGLLWFASSGVANFFGVGRPRGVVDLVGEAVVPCVGAPREGSVTFPYVQRARLVTSCRY